MIKNGPCSRTTTKDRPGAMKKIDRSPVGLTGDQIISRRHWSPRKNKKNKFQSKSRGPCLDINNSMKKKQNNTGLVSPGNPGNIVIEGDKMLKKPTPDRAGGPRNEQTKNTGGEVKRKQWLAHGTREMA